MDKQEQGAGRKKEIMSWIWAAAIVILLRMFVVQAFKIPSTSMVPTLKISDRLLANKILYKIKEPERGDVIIFRYPEDPSRDFVKRLIGLPGETVMIKNGKILINGSELKEPGSIASRYYYSEGDYGVTGGMKIPENSYYALGDNSIISKDSRFWGVVPKKNLIGKAAFIYWPPWRMGIVR